MKKNDKIDPVASHVFESNEAWKDMGSDFLKLFKSSNYWEKVKEKAATEQAKKSKEEMDLIEEIFQLPDLSNYSDEKFGIYIEDLRTGKQYCHNADREFVAASTYKLPLAMLVYDEIGAGNLSLNETIQLQPVDMEDGPVASYGIGAEVSIEELLSSMILYSDNTAAQALFRKMGGWLEFSSRASKYGESSNYLGMNRKGNYISPGFLRDCLKRIYLHQEDYSKLLDDLKKAEGFFSGSAGGATIAQKWGAYDSARNCAGIVYTESPYIIVILTEGVYIEDLFKQINDYVSERLN